MVSVDADLLLRAIGGGLHAIAGPSTFLFAPFDKGGHRGFSDSGINPPDPLL